METKAMTDRIREIATVYAANVYEVDNLYNAIVDLVYDEIEACEKVAEKGKVAVLCPYGNAKPGDPTWNHTDEDICPVCKKNGRESIEYCTSITVGGQIAATIRARKPMKTQKHSVDLKSYELAEHFLQDSKTATDETRMGLAIEIQMTVEEFLKDLDL